MIDGGKVVVSTTEQGVWNDAVEYFKWCEANPIITKHTIMVGKDAGKKVEKESPRPYQIKELCLFCGCTEEWLKEIKRSKRKDSTYYHVISRILYVIYTQNASMAMIGAYNPIMTAKLLGMDNEDDTVGGSVTVNVVQGLPALSDSEDEVLEKLDLENGIVVKRES